jgi:hypothetical protein
MLLMVFGMGAVGACAALCRDDGEHGVEGGSRTRVSVRERVRREDYLVSPVVTRASEK